MKHTGCLPKNDQNGLIKPKSKQKIQSGYKFKCRKCHQRFSTFEKMNSHYEFCEREVKCKTCGISVTKNTYIKCHRELCDPNYRKSVEDRKCNVCGYVFMTRRRLRNHRLKYKGTCVTDFDPSKNVRASKYDDVKPKNLKQRKDVICNICAKVFHFSSSLEKHSTIVHGETITIPSKTETESPQNSFAFME